jgi:putative SOS response-associated peptidase YedK
VIINDGENKLDFYRWGLVPSWTKPENIGKYSLINARSETAAEKASFKASFRRRRCLVLADGFFEWSKSTSGKGKTPYYISLKDHAPFAFAGLWEIWNSPDGDQLRTTCILTTQPNDLVKPIHERMPVILPQDGYQTWLTEGEVQIEELQALMTPYPADLMQAYPVSTYVNSPKNNSPQCIQTTSLL